MRAAGVALQCGIGSIGRKLQPPQTSVLHRDTYRRDASRDAIEFECKVGLACVALAIGQFAGRSG